MLTKASSIALYITESCCYYVSNGLKINHILNMERA